jgi:hypothetical protein
LAPVWPLTPVGHPVRLPSGRKIKIKNKKNLWLLLPAGKEGKKYFSFWFSIPKIPKIPKFPEFLELPEFPELCGLRGRSRKKKKVFLA